MSLFLSALHSGTHDLQLKDIKDNNFIAIQFFEIPFSKIEVFIGSGPCSSNGEVTASDWAGGRSGLSIGSRPDKNAFPSRPGTLRAQNFKQ